MSETCQYCGADSGRSTEQVAGRWLKRWQCGSGEDLDGSIIRESHCYERQLTAVQAELERVQRDARDLVATVRNGWTYSDWDKALDAVKEFENRNRKES